MGDDYGSDFTETNFMSILGVVILVSVYDWIGSIVHVVFMDRVSWI